jgi:molecular chaperone GrpE
MTDRDPRSDEQKRPAESHFGSDRPRPKVRVTDRRRVRPEDPVDQGERAQAGAPAETDEVALVRQEAAEYREHLQRLQAEFDNFRKRTLREQTSTLERAAEPLVRRLLEVLDEFDLALMAAERTPDFEQFLRGVELVYAKLRDILESEGLHRIEAKGKRFDPELHEALMHSEGEGDGELVVDDVFRQGYSLKGKVLRPAGVRVTRK